MKMDNRLWGYYEFKTGERGWCKSVLENAIAINYDDGSYTVVPPDHWCLENAKEVKDDRRALS